MRRMTSLSNPCLLCFKAFLFSFEDEELCSHCVRSYINKKNNYNDCYIFIFGIICNYEEDSFVIQIRISIFHFDNKSENIRLHNK